MLDLLKDLSAAENEGAADFARSKFEYRVVWNESVTEAAEHFIPLVLAAVPTATQHGRARIFDLLYSLGAGYSNFADEVHYASADLERRCRKQVKFGVALYFHYWERGTEAEKLYLPDLLEMCARDDRELGERILWWLETLLPGEANQKVAKVYQRNISDLRSNYG